MSFYHHHVFVCLNERPADNPNGCCMSKGADKIFDQLKSAAKAARLDNIRINKSGCLGRCSEGPVAVIYPDGEWLTQLTADDVGKIVEKIN